MNFKKTAIAAAATFAFFGATQAQAGTVSLSYQTPGSAYGSEGWYSGISQTILDRGAPVGQVYNGTAGAFRFTDGIDAITAFCIDPYSYLRIGEVFSVTENANVMDNIDRLFNVAYAGVTDALSASAFQVALWEIIAETDSVLDVTAGNHSIANKNVASAAQSFLDDLSNAPSGGYRYTIYSNSGQDQISASPVPLPASALLLLGGMSGFAALRRKKA